MLLIRLKQYCLKEITLSIIYVITDIYDYRCWDDASSILDLSAVWMFGVWR